MQGKLLDHFITASSVYAVMSTFDCSPDRFEFTPESSNAHWSFDYRRLFRLGQFVEAALLSGSQIEVLDITDEVVINCLAKDFWALFQASNFFDGPPEGAPKLVWKAHFHWEDHVRQGFLSSSSETDYQLDIVGLAKNVTTQPSHSLIIPVLISKKSNPLKFVAELSQIFSNFDRYAHNERVMEALPSFQVSDYLVFESDKLQRRYEQAKK